MQNLAQDLYKQGYSCSEAVLKAAIVKGYAHEELLKIATAFSRGMYSGCLCGAVAGAQIVISSLEGRTSNMEDSSKCRMMSKTLVDKFKERNKITCCRALGGRLPEGSVERKEFCTKLVGDAAEILSELVSQEVKTEV